MVAQIRTQHAQQMKERAMLRRMLPVRRLQSLERTALLQKTQAAATQLKSPCQKQPRLVIIRLMTGFCCSIPMTAVLSPLATLWRVSFRCSLAGTLGAWRFMAQAQVALDSADGRYWFVMWSLAREQTLFTLDHLPCFTALEAVHQPRRGMA
jgi:hypothetical protein